MINGRPVTVITDVSTQPLATCVAALDNRIAQEGWHDQIHRAIEPEKAYVIYSQRNADPCCAHEVKIVFWKGIVKEGRTYTESWVYRLEQREVNTFLDTRLREIALVFKTTPLTSRL